MVIVSFKLRRHDRHVWIMRAGQPTGSTLRGRDADRAFELGAPLFALAHPEAPERVRALSVDLKKQRLLATVDVGPVEKPHAKRVDGATVSRAVSPALLAFLQAGLPSGGETI